MPVAISGAKGYLFPGALGQGHLPIYFAVVYVTDLLSFAQELIHTRHGISVKGGDFIELSEVVTKRRVLSSFGTITIGLAQGLWEGSMIPS